jgi:enoyl-CoA hydratase/carnithine racemase
MSERIQVEVKDGIADVRLCRPDKRNALDRPMFQGLVQAGKDLSADPSVRVAVLHGEGPAFCAGIDFVNFAEMLSGNLSANSDDVKKALGDKSEGGASWFQLPAWIWYEAPFPVIAAVHGAAYGAGLQVALGADMRIVAPDAKLAFVEVNWGLVPDMSGTQALRRLVPLDVAKRMSMTGLPVTGEQAVRYGLATEVSDTPYETAREIAEIIAKKSPEAIRSLKRLLNQSALVPLAEGLAMEFELSGALMGTPNQIEAIGASFEKREPVFQDPTHGEVAR